MAQKMDLWYLYMALSTFNMGNLTPTLVIGYPMAKTSCMPNFSLSAPHSGLEDGPVVLGGVPDHVRAPGHVRDGVDHHSPGQDHPHAKFQSYQVSQNGALGLVNLNFPPLVPSVG